MDLRRRLVVGLLGFVLFQCDSVASEQGLLVHLPLTHDLKDHSPNRHSTTNHNKLEFRHEAVWFSGKATGIGLTNINLAARPFTVSMWINVTGSERMYGLVEQFGANGRNRWLHLMLRGSRQPYLGFYMNDAISPRGIQAHKWTHLLFSYDGKYQMIWIDGEPACARKARPYRGDSSKTLWIGKSPRWKNVPSQHFQGGMRDFRIYDRVLTLQEVYELADRPFRQVASLGETGIPDPANMPRSLSRARDGGLPYLLIDRGHLTIGGEHAQIYELEVTQNLGVPWESLGLVTNVNGRVEFDDPGYTKQRQRFYRLKFVGSR